MGNIRHYLRSRFVMSNGFILPVVIMLALGISTVGIFAFRTVSDSSVTLTDQYFNQLAKEASQAGARMAISCINGGTTTWSTLAPNTSCAGTAGSGLSYLTKNENWESTFSVAAPTGTGPYYIVATGTVKQKNSAGSTIKTYTSSAKVRTGQTTTTLPAKRVSKLAASWYLSCGIGTQTGVGKPSAFCMGAKSCNATGDGATMGCNGTIYGAVTGYPVAVDASASSPLNNKTVTDITIGNYHMVYGFACAVAYTGTDPTTRQPYCWGHQLSGNSSTGTGPRLIPGFTGKTVTKISAGDLHACAIAYTTSIGPSDSRVYCWGVRQFGALGTGTSGANWVTTPVLVNGGDLGNKTVVDLSAGYRYTCAVAYTTAATTDARPYCWGDNTAGNLGTGNNLTYSTPKATIVTGALSGKTVSSISAGSLYIALTCSGYDSEGNCSTYDDAAQTHTCVTAYPSNGSPTNTAAYCWGSNSYGELGTNSTSPYTSNTPTTVFTGAGSDIQNRTVTSIASGGWNTCALSYPTAGPTTQVKASCWGNRGCGALGDGQQGTSWGCGGNITTRAVAVATTGTSALVGKTPITIAAGIYEGCVTAYDGTDTATERGYCWGGNDWGNLGNGTTCVNCFSTNKWPLALDVSSSSAVGTTTTTTSGGSPIFY